MENAWKGRAWYIAFSWPLYSIKWTANIAEYQLLVQIGICLGWIIFLSAIVYAIFLIRKEIKKT